MSLRPVVRRARVDHDVQEAIEYYRQHDAPQAVLAWINALEHTITQLQRHPSAGSPRYAHALELPGLRVWPFRRFPYAMFYVERPDHIDVWRVLHEQRDIPSWLLSNDPR